MASFMNETWRRTAWPSDAADLLRPAVRLGEAHGDLGHGRGHELEFLGAPHQHGQEPEQRDGQDDGGRTMTIIGLASAAQELGAAAIIGRQHRPGEQARRSRAIRPSRRRPS